jgi:hypothetical protein
MKEKTTINNSTWAFYLDQIYSYAFLDDFLSKDECEKIIKIATILLIHCIHIIII